MNKTSTAAIRTTRAIGELASYIATLCKLIQLIYRLHNWLLAFIHAAAMRAIIDHAQM